MRHGLPLLGLFVILGFAPLAQAASDGQLVLTMTEPNHEEPVPCRMHLFNAKHVPQHGGKTLPFWHDHFVCDGRVTLGLNKGEYTFEIERGLETLTQRGNFTINQFADDTKSVELHRFCNLAEEGWWSGDLHVERDAQDLPLLMGADDLHVACVVDAGRAPAKRPTSKRKGAVLDLAAPTVMIDDQHWFTQWGTALPSSGGSIAILAQSEAMAAPSDLEPLKVIELLMKSREQHGTWHDVQRIESWDLPLWIGLGLVDSIELTSSQFARDAIGKETVGCRPRDRQRYTGVTGSLRSGEDIYRQLLESGLRIPLSAGSGSGRAPSPVGYNRAYVFIEGKPSPDAWWQGLKAGHAFVTNGPLMRVNVEGRPPGETFRVERDGSLELEIALTLSTREPIDYLELVRDGQVVYEARLDKFKAEGGQLPKQAFKESGWFLLRGVTNNPRTPRFAVTAPYWVEVGYQPRISRQAVQFFLTWLAERREQLGAAAQNGPWAEHFQQAEAFWKQRLDQATVD